MLLDNYLLTVQISRPKQDCVIYVEVLAIKASTKLRFISERTHTLHHWYNAKMIHLWYRISYSVSRKQTHRNSFFAHGCALKGVNVFVLCLYRICMQCVCSPFCICILCDLHSCPYMHVCVRVCYQASGEAIRGLLGLFRLSAAWWSPRALCKKTRVITTGPGVVFLLGGGVSLF